MKSTTGYLYAIQPLGMATVKIGCTRFPVARADQIAAFSPVPMTFRHLLDVGGVNIARAHEQNILGWSRHGAGYGEWRTDLALIDDLFAAVAPAVDVSDQFAISNRKPAGGSRDCGATLQDKLTIAAYYDRCPMPMYEARQAIGLRDFGASVTRQTVLRAYDWLVEHGACTAANPASAPATQAGAA